MENNFENQTPDTEIIYTEPVYGDVAEKSPEVCSEENLTSEVEEAVALAEEYTVSSDIAENLPKLEEDPKAKKKREKKAKKEKAHLVPFANLKLSLAKLWSFSSLFKTVFSSFFNP